MQSSISRDWALSTLALPDMSVRYVAFIMQVVKKLLFGSDKRLPSSSPLFGET